MLDIADKLLFWTFFVLFKFYAVYFFIAHFVLTLYYFFIYDALLDLSRFCFTLVCILSVKFYLDVSWIRKFSFYVIFIITIDIK